MAVEVTTTLCTDRTFRGWDSLQKCLSMVVAVDPPPPPPPYRKVLVVGLFTKRSIDGCSGADHTFLLYRKVYG